MHLKLSVFTLPLLICSAVTVQASEPVFSSGLANETVSGLIDCGNDSRPSAVGEITTEDGETWTVPAATQFTAAPIAFDLYNECAGVEPDTLAEVNLDEVPVVDAGGDETFTAYIFADNYFEFYANGVLIAVDAVPFTPFNASVVKFTAQRPVSIAVLGVDWEENLGLGSEAGRGKKFQPGDAGVVMLIEDDAGDVAAVTDSGWRAQTFYVSPVYERDCVVVEGNVRASDTCSTEGRNSADGISAAFWALPEGWEQPDFDAGDWPAAVEFTNDTVGVNNKPAYTNFTDLFDRQSADAQFIWSSNLVLDNLVVLRGMIDP